MINRDYWIMRAYRTFQDFFNGVCDYDAYYLDELEADKAGDKLVHERKFACYDVELAKFY